MKLLIISPSFWPAMRIGGPVTSVFDLCRFLKKHDVDITVCTTNVYLEDKISCNTFTEIEGIKIHYFGYSRYFEFLGETGWQYSKQLKRKLKSDYSNFDIIYIIGIWNFPSTFAIRFLSKKKAPIIIAPHGSLDPFKFSQKGYKKKLYYALFLKHYIQRSFIHYFTSSEANKSSEFLRIPSDKVVIIPNGIDIKDHYKDPSSQKLFELYPNLKNKFLILYLGRLHPIKGIEIIIKSLKYLEHKSDKIHVVIAGTGESDYEEKLKYLAESISSKNIVTFTGLVEGELKSSLLSVCNLFVLLSYSEAFSMSVLEALAYNKPVIIGRKCNFDEIENEYCGFVIQNDPQRLAEKIEVLYNDSNLCVKMGESARSLVTNKYNWEKIALEFKEKLEEIVADNNTLQN
ncbi:MAG: hypothetical protein B6D44_00385 [Ignavibacteriales bacterium UTCHB2]|nr:MAG: hypothetical protein B6D44_00385 [Ignavibacteriales bacterium UTCHB2]